jgi:RND superfamily putative drug exporter
MRVALRGVIEPIIASGSTVAIGLMVLLLSQLNNNRSLGPVGAIGIVSAMFTMLTLLPAILVLFGRWIFWPRIPHHDSSKSKALHHRYRNFIDSYGWFCHNFKS